MSNFKVSIGDIKYAAMPNFCFQSTLIGAFQRDMELFFSSNSNIDGVFLTVKNFCLQMGQITIKEMGQAQDLGHSPLSSVLMKLWPC